MKTITILIPAYNEAEALPLLLPRLNALADKNKKYNFDFLFINDGSKDSTIEILQQEAVDNPRVSYIDLSRNFGKEIAMMAGFDHAWGDAVVIIDADLQDPPELIPRMIKLWESGYQDVYAKRRTRAGESFVKKKTSEWFYTILQKSTSISIQKNTGDFRLLDQKCIEALRQFRESERYTKGMFSWVGFKKKEIIYDRDPRAAGSTKWNYPKLINFAIDGITSFTTTPLRISTFLGFAVSFVAFLYIIYLLVRPLFGAITGDGYSSLMAVSLFLGGVQLLSLGIIGEYVGRIFNETKNRPLYFINNYHGGKNYKKPNNQA